MSMNLCMSDKFQLTRHFSMTMVFYWVIPFTLELRHEKRAVIAYVDNTGLCKPVYPHSLDRIYAVRSRKRQVKGKKPKD